MSTPAQRCHLLRPRRHLQLNTHESGQSPTAPPTGTSPVGNWDFSLTIPSPQHLVDHPGLVTSPVRHSHLRIAAGLSFPIPASLHPAFCNALPWLLATRSAHRPGSPLQEVRCHLIPPPASLFCLLLPSRCSWINDPDQEHVLLGPCGCSLPPPHTHTHVELLVLSLHPAPRASSTHQALALSSPHVCGFLPPSPPFLSACLVPTAPS